MTAPRFRVVLVVVLTALAYHHSLLALATTLGADTPMAYLGLVPVLALGVALVLGRPRPEEGRLPHRQADWIIGVPLLAVAGVVALVLPDRLSYEYWTNRIDLIGLPFFAAGLVALLLGSRMLYRVRLPLAALVLAWPLPYELVLDGAVGGASAVTLTAMRWAAPALGVGRAVGGTLFEIGAGAGRFSVNVAPQCAGTSSTIGFLFVGGSVVAVLGGRRRAKLVWLVTGFLMQLLLNVARIVAVFVAGDRYGERVAIEWLHPYIGLVLFTVSVGVLVALLPRFGVPLRLPEAARDRPPGGHAPRAVAIVLIVTCALGLAVRNGQLRRFDPYLGVGSASPYRPLAVGPTRVDGWIGRHTSTIGWAKPYFGSSSTWQRLTYVAVTGAPRTVFVDVVNTSDLGSFSRYGLEACYRFHDYDLIRSGPADVGAPARAQTLGYRDGSGNAWAVASWVWPVGRPDRLRYERVVVIGAFDGTPADAGRVRGELLAFARAVVTSQRVA